MPSTCRCGGLSGPSGQYVSPRAELAPAGDGSSDWVVSDHDEVSYRAPLNAYRVSVLWKADVYPSEQQRSEVEGDTLSLVDVARIFDADLAAKGVSLRFDLDQIDGSGLKNALAEVYPEAVPVGAGKSVFDSYN